MNGNSNNGSSSNSGGNADANNNSNNSSIGSSNGNSITKVLRGSDSVLGAILRVIENATKRYDSCVDLRMPAQVLGSEKMWKAMQGLHGRGIRHRAIVEITAENLPFVKEATKIMDLRHLEGISGNFAVTDSEYMSAASLALGSRPVEPVPQLVYSNLEEIVEQQRYVFDILWSRAIPAERRIREIEQGLEPPYTAVLNSQDEISKAISKSISESTGLAIYSDTRGMQMIYNHYFDYYRKALARQKTGVHTGIRWLITVDQENKDIVRAFLDAGVQVRHTTYMSPMTFALDGRALYMTVDEMPEGKMIQSNFMITNEPPYLKHFSILFEELWSDGADAASRIAEIEAGMAADAEVIRNPAKIACLYKEAIDRAEKEVMLIWTAPNAFARQRNLGVIESLKRAASMGTKARILVSECNSRSGDARRQIEELVACGARVQRLSERQLEEGRKEHAATEGSREEREKEVEGAHLNTAIVDGKVSWIVEIKDNSRHDFAEAVGTAVVSTGSSIVLSYVRIFEALWLEAELVARLCETDAMQKDFVNVAAHELRTPITSMLMAASNAKPASEGAEEVVMTRMQYDIILRNTKRLAGLVNDILDASRIENGTFALRKEPVDLTALASEAVAEARSQDAGIGNDNDDDDYDSGGRAKVVILRGDDDKSGGRGPMVRADPDRIRQVFVNLLTNAAKFTDGGGGDGDSGTITISIRVEGDQAIASVSDTGTGIDGDMLPRLFQKFTAKSFKGIGLGLYICRWIIELHGGRIWAQNNPGGKGATFTFTLPISGGATAATATTKDAAKQQ